MKRAIFLFLLLPACNTLHKALGDHEPSGSATTYKTIKAVIAGQSNARIPTQWEYLEKMMKTNGVKFEWEDVAVSATSSYQWASDSQGMLTNLLLACEKDQPDLLLIIQGEADSETPAQNYANNWARVFEKVEEVSHPKIYMALCSYNVHGHGDPREGQKLLISRGLVHQGPDVDVYRQTLYGRDNGLHFTETGYSRIAKDWMEILGHGF